MSYTTYSLNRLYFDVWGILIKREEVHDFYPDYIGSPPSDKVVRELSEQHTKTPFDRFELIERTEI